MASGQYVDTFEVWSLGATTDTTAPSVPAGLTASAAGSTQINLAWTASTDANGVQGYKLYRGGTYLASVGPVGSTAFSDTGLSPATAYAYTVSAIDGSGNESAQSTGASATTATASDASAPSVPSGLTASSPAYNVVNLTWTASTDNVGVARYSIYRGGTLLAAVSGTTTTFTDRSTAPSTAYSYTVKASDAAGNTSAASSAASVTTPAQSGTRLDDDAFSGSNGTLLSAHTSDSGRGWSEIFGDPAINGNHVTATKAGSNARLTGAGVADVDVRMTFNLGADGVSRGNAIRFRYSDNSNFLFLKARRGSTGVNQIEFWQRVAGTTTKIVGVNLLSNDLAANTDYTLRVVASGSTLTGYLNGVQKIQTTTSFNQTATGVCLTFEETIGHDHLNWPHFRAL